MPVIIALTLMYIGYKLLVYTLVWITNDTTKTVVNTPPIPVQKPVIEELRIKPVQKSPVYQPVYRKPKPVRLAVKPKWFVVARALENPMSPAEIIIDDILKQYRCEYYREVAFHDLKTSEYGHARFDFLIVTPVGELIIEYDGKLAHSTEDRLAVDRMKDKYCRSIGIPVVRYSAKHYYHLDKEIDKLLKEYKVYKE